MLTRGSYARYDEHLPALAGIVQGFLMTRHMLFVGFSLTDDNFHLRDALQQFVDRLSDRQTLDAVRQTVAWPQVERMLAGLGYDAKINFRNS